jgi:predicted phosphodiesterase
MTDIKIGIVSDLHAEFWSPKQFAVIGDRLRTELADVDVLLLAGDIDNGPDSVQTAQTLFPDQQICLVAGNHEFYSREYINTVGLIRDRAYCTNVSFLNRESREFLIKDQKLRVLGATLWTDFALFGDPIVNMLSAKRGLNDFRLIRYGDRLLVPQDTVDMHAVDKQWLLAELEKPYDGLTIVLTHHAPVSFGAHVRFLNDALSPCFCSRLEDVFTRDDVALVVWGHTHHCVDQVIGTTRFVSNQTGYVSGNSVETKSYGKVIILNS